LGACFPQGAIVNRGAIGTGAIILCGVTIGEHAIVGVGAVVKKDVAAGTFAGNLQWTPVRFFLR
jgi:UDP-2-acetamido-3-amino-2,3-dideoxy-glucuronate N-acetyltransferase